MNLQKLIDEIKKLYNQEQIITGFFNGKDFTSGKGVTYLNKDLIIISYTPGSAFIVKYNNKYLCVPAQITTKENNKILNQKRNKKKKTVENTNYKIKILFSVLEYDEELGEDVRNFYVGGDRKKPKKIYSLNKDIPIGDIKGYIYNYGYSKNKYYVVLSYQEEYGYYDQDFPIVKREHYLIIDNNNNVFEPITKEDNGNLFSNLRYLGEGNTFNSYNKFFTYTESEVPTESTDNIPSCPDINTGFDRIYLSQNYPLITSGNLLSQNNLTFTYQFNPTSDLFNPFCGWATLSNTHSINYTKNIIYTEKLTKSIYDLDISVNSSFTDSTTIINPPTVSLEPPTINHPKIGNYNASGYYSSDFLDSNLIYSGNATGSFFKANFNTNPNSNTNVEQSFSYTNVPIILGLNTKIVNSVNNSVTSAEVNFNETVYSNLNYTITNKLIIDNNEYVLKTSLSFFKEFLEDYLDDIFSQNLTINDNLIVTNVNLALEITSLLISETNIKDYIDSKLVNTDFIIYKYRNNKYEYYELRLTSTSLVSNNNYNLNFTVISEKRITDFLYNYPKRNSIYTNLVTNNNTLQDLLLKGVEPNLFLNNFEELGFTENSISSSYNIRYHTTILDENYFNYINLPYPAFNSNIDSNNFLMPEANVLSYGIGGRLDNRELDYGELLNNLLSRGSLIKNNFYICHLNNKIKNKDQNIYVEHYKINTNTDSPDYGAIEKKNELLNIPCFSLKTSNCFIHALAYYN